MPNLVVSGNEITDDVRRLSVQGDGRVPETSFGIWQAATNLLPHGDTTASLLTGDAGVTRSDDVAVQLLSTPAVKIVVPDTLSKQTYFASTADEATVSPSTFYTCSVWVYADATNAGKSFSFSVNEKTSGGVFVQQLGFINQTLVLGWQHVAIRSTTSGTTGKLQPIVTLNGVAGTFWFNHLQVEASAIATPYIRTSGSTASRAACNVSLPQRSLLGPQGWAAFRVRMEILSTDVSPYGAASWQRVFHMGTNGGAAGNVQELVWADDSDSWIWSNGSVTVATIADTFAVGDIKTLVCTWSGTALKLSLNGANFVSVTAESATNMTDPQASIGCRYDGGGTFARWIDGEILWALFGKGVLTNTDAATIHAYGNTDPVPDFATLPDMASLHWDAETTYLRDHGLVAAPAFHSGSFGPF